MTGFASIATFGWLPLTLVLFAVLPARRAATVALIGGWLFLPMARFELTGVPDYTKIVAVCLPILLGMLVFDSRTLFALRPRWFDAPMVMWCVAPAFSSISNHLGAHDAASAGMTNFLNWGLPYLIGRIYYADLRGVRELALGIFIGGLIYIPLCLWEMRMSPQLHRTLYGFITFKFTTTYRFGGSRPVVFMQHGIALGLWMTSATVVGVWLWRSRAVRQLWGFGIGWLAGAQLVVTVLCRSLGGLLLLVAGLGALYVAKWHRRRLAIICLVALGPAYILVRNLGALPTDTLVSMAAKISQDRAKSLEGRLKHEELLVAKAWKRPLCGWGGWGRQRIYDERGRDTSVTDALWVITIGQNGLIGLLSLGTVLLLPIVVMVRKIGPHEWANPELAPAACLAVLMPLYGCDCLMNAMLNPIFMVIAGGLLEFSLRMRAPVRSRAVRRPARMGRQATTVRTQMARLGRVDGGERPA